VTHDQTASARFERVITLKDGMVENDQKQSVTSEVCAMT